MNLLIVLAAIAFANDQPLDVCFLETTPMEMRSASSIPSLDCRMDPDGDPKLLCHQAGAKLDRGLTIYRCDGLGSGTGPYDAVYGRPIATPTAGGLP